MKKGHKASMTQAQKKRRSGRLIARLGIAAVALGATIGIAACGSSGSSLNLVAYSTPQQVYEQSLEPGFKDTSDGKDVDFSNSFGASGDQSRAVESGQPADVVEFSLQPDMQRLVDAGIVAADWDKNQYKGNVTDSVVALVVRKGNPKHITGWNDLVKPGVEVITPNPFTSGGARWNVMAAYGSQIAQGKSDQQATDYLTKLFHNVSVQDKSARDALQTFTGGKGDVMIAYENEAITAQKKGEKVDYIVPDQTILIENPIAVSKDGPNTDKAKAFASYLTTPPAQKIFASNGYRPVIKSLVDKKKFPTPKQLFTIQKFGGWDTVMTKFFDKEKSVMADIEKGLGVSTAG
jgi:sulfate/thiosulfate transport system substrate-binding protein